MELAAAYSRNLSDEIDVPTGKCFGAGDTKHTHSGRRKINRAACAALLLTNGPNRADYFFFSSFFGSAFFGSAFFGSSFFASSFFACLAMIMSLIAS